MTRCLLLALTVSLLLTDNSVDDDREILTATSNPHTDELPTLSVWQDYVKKKGLYYRNLSACFPNVPGFTCDLRCFELPGIHYQSARELTDRQVELRHAWDEHDWEIVTTATPHRGAVDVVARLAAT